jgi:hypothetical protein
MPDHEWNPHAGHLLGDRHRLLRIAGIVADLELQLLAKQTARRVDIGDRELGAVLELRTEARFRPRHRAHHGNADLLRHGDT